MLYLLRKALHAFGNMVELVLMQKKNALYLRFKHLKKKAIGYSTIQIFVGPGDFHIEEAVKAARRHSRLTILTLAKLYSYSFNF